MSIYYNNESNQNKDYNYFEQKSFQINIFVAEVWEIGHIQPKINLESSNLETILSEIKSYGYVEKAERIKHFFTLDEEDLGEVEKPKLDSVKGFSKFLRKNYFDKPPRIGLSYDGNISADWELENEEFVNIEFLSNLDAKYVFIKDKNELTNVTNISELLSKLEECKISKS